MLSRIIEGLLNLPRTDAFVAKAESRKGPDGIFRKLLDTVEIRAEISAQDLARIPRTGPVIVVANHPTGFAEGVAIPAVLDSVRSDVTVMGHTYFKRWPALASRMVLVNPQAPGSAKASNAAGLKTAARNLRRGECLMMFPGAEVARPQSNSLIAEELPWRPGLANLVRFSRASVLPVHISGNNGLMFRLLSRIHPRLGTLLLCREFLNKRGGTLRIVVGQPIPASKFTSADSPSDAVAMCREKVLGLQFGSDRARNKHQRIFSDERLLNLVDFSISLNHCPK